MLGAEELFPLGFKQDVGIKNGTLVTYYKAKTRNYLSRLISYSGYPYIAIFFGMIIIYTISWWAHAKFISVFCSFLSIKSKPGKNSFIAQSLSKNIGFKPATYDFKQIPKYAEAVSTIELSLADDINVRTNNFSSPSNMESQDQMKDSQNFSNTVGKSKFANVQSSMFEDDINSPLSRLEDEKSNKENQDGIEEIELH